jgi:hypothetical protein
METKEYKRERALITTLCMFLMLLGLIIVIFVPATHLPENTTLRHVIFIAGFMSCVSAPFLDGFLIRICAQKYGVNIEHEFY